MAKRWSNDGQVVAIKGPEAVVVASRTNFGQAILRVLNMQVVIFRARSTPPASRNAGRDSPVPLGLSGTGLDTCTSNNGIVKWPLWQIELAENTKETDVGCGINEGQAPTLDVAPRSSARLHTWLVRSGLGEALAR